jgi:uncharacterized membrane protein
MNQGLKYILGLGLVCLLRLLPHPPNVEPIMATLMPFAKRWGMLAGAVFGAAAVIIFDLLSGTLGIWSLSTIGGFVFLGLAAGWYFKHPQFGGGRLDYVAFAIIGTILYDALTGLTIGPIFFGQSFMQALIGQIPFTLYHLAGNIVLAFVVSPLIERFIVANPRLETKAVLTQLGVKAH